MIENLLTKRLIAIVLLGVSAIAGYLFWVDYKKTVNRMDNYHNRYKEFLYLLENTPKGVNLKLSRPTVERILKRYRLEAESIRRIGDRFEIKIREVPANLLIPLLRDFERYGEVVEFEAVDNTGKGRFYTTLVVRS